MNLKDIYTNYFIKKGHQYLKSASIVPENQTTLFTTAGVQPLIPYLILGEKHPMGNRLTSFQKCLRLTDIDNIGDSYHHTFFEMLGNWSLGDYFKNESIDMSFEFLTQELGLDINRLAVSVFAGIKGIPQDVETAEKWMSLGISKERIAFLGTDDNWWPTITETGPCGPDTEIFYWRDETTPAPTFFNPNDNRWIEIWNNVFIQYYRDENMNLKELANKNVDTGMGFERVTSVLNKTNDNYESPIFRPLIRCVELASGKKYEEETNKRDMRIISDHIRAITMICSDDKNIFPSNKDRGYILRRLIRRILISTKKLEINNFEEMLTSMVNEIEKQFAKYYPQVSDEKLRTIQIISDEKTKFDKVIIQGEKKINKAIETIKNANLNEMNSLIIFRLFETHGVPFDLTYSILRENDITYNVEEVESLFEQHKIQSQKSSEQKFGDGIAVKKLTSEKR